MVEFLTKQNSQHTYDTEIQEKIDASRDASGNGNTVGGVHDIDAYFRDAGNLFIQKDKASIGMLQRAFKIGFNRAARIMDQLADAGLVGPEEGTKPRKVLMSKEDFEQYIEESM